MKQKNMKNNYKKTKQSQVMKDTNTKNSRYLLSKTKIKKIKKKNRNIALGFAN
jgi:hypothetical protein